MHCYPFVSKSKANEIDTISFAFAEAIRQIPVLVVLAGTSATMMLIWSKDKLRIIKAHCNKYEMDTNGSSLLPAMETWKVTNVPGSLRRIMQIQVIMYIYNKKSRTISTQ